VPYGQYRLGATGGEADWVRPLERLVDVAPGGTSAGNILQFRQTNATLSGNLTIAGAAQSGVAHVWAWSDDGGFAQGDFPVTSAGAGAQGIYQLNVISGTTWNLRAVFETADQYWFGQAQAVVSGANANQDIALDGPFARPAPVVVTFDSSELQQIELLDGTHIFIPAGAMPADGQVTLRIVPMAALPYQQHANVFRYGYAFLATDASGEPIETHFNQDVVITFSYTDQELQRLHIHENWLKPAYYSTTTQRWTFPDSFVVDTQANRVSMQIDHFCRLRTDQPDDVQRLSTANNPLNRQTPVS
jgi:hypothetical protein